MSSQGSKILILLAVILLAAAGYLYLTQPDRRSVTQKAGDAIHDLDKGPDKAARQLEDRTPGQKMGDAIKDTGNDVGNSVKHATSSQ